MPYFQRKPVEELVDAVRSIVPIPGLPSRGRAPATRGIAGTGPVSPAAAITGIVEQATAVLASARPSGSAGSSAGPGAGSIASTQSTQVSQLQAQLNGLIEQVVALAGRPPGLQTAAPPSSIFPGRAPPSDAADLVVEPRAGALAAGAGCARGRGADEDLAGKRRRAARANRVLQHRADRRRGGAYPRRMGFVPAAGIDTLTRKDWRSDCPRGRPMANAVRCLFGVGESIETHYLHAVLVVQVERREISGGAA